MRRLRQILLTSIVAVVPMTAPCQITPDRVFHNGVVLTMSDNLTAAEALAVSGDSILAVGSNDEILNLSGDVTRLVDLVGRTVIPGFVDAHSHLFSEANDRGMTLQQVHGIALAHGITAVGNVSTPRQVVDDMLRFRDEGRLRVRTNLYLALTDFCGEYLGNWYRDYPPTQDHDARLRIAGIKLFVDGGTCGDIATSFEYESGHGDLWRTQDGLNQLVADVDLAGYQLAMHAQGDLATEQALNAIASLDPSGENPMRHRIEHNSFVRKDLLPMYDQIGAVAILFGRFPTCAEVRFDALSNRYGEKNVTWLEDWRSLLDANPNLHAGWHSDYPYFVIDPIRHLASYVTRAQVDDDGSVCEPPPWLLAHAITPIEALTLMTRGAAYALGRNDQIGTLEAGKRADFVILSQNPTAVAHEDIIETEILATFVDGSLMYCRPGNEQVYGLPVSATRDLPDDRQPRLQSIYPNPTTGSVTVSYRVERAGPVRISVYDVTGRIVADLVDLERPPGSYQSTWESADIAPGVYIVRMTTPRDVEIRSVIHLR